MSTAMVGIPVAGGQTMDALVVKPAAAREKLPLVMIIHDILGFNDDTVRIAKRMVAGPMPLIAVAPNLYQGLGPKPLCVIKSMRSLRRREGVIFDRLSATQETLAAAADVDASRVAVIGFCIGGGFALMYAVQAQLRVVAPFYGDVPRDAAELEGICPVVGGYGERDKMFASHGHRLVEHLNTLEVVHDVKFYDDAGHAYMNQLTGMAQLGRYSPMHSQYDVKASDDSWERIFRFLGQHL